ncbi:MAG: hypothetical protein WDA53_07630, partial [Bacillota bacterium]
MLKRKMLRDIIENKGNYLACAWIIIIGLMIFTALSTLSQTVHLAQSRFYTEQNFADGFAQVAATSPSAVESLKKIEGIKEIQGRIVKDVLLYQPEAKVNIYLRLISFDPGLIAPINSPMLHLGQLPTTDDLNALIDNKFYAAHNLNLNDTLEIIIGGKKRSIAITGVGSSPEFVYALPDASYIYP